jgi:hypothetical protein
MQQASVFQIKTASDPSLFKFVHVFLIVVREA